MAVSLIIEVLEELQINGIDDVPKSLKTLEHLFQKLQNCNHLKKEFQCQSEDDVIEFSQLACTTYFKLLPSAKLPRAFDKVLKLLPTKYMNTINQRVELEMLQLLTQDSPDNPNQIKLLFSLLEQNSFAKKCIKKYFPEVTAVLQIALKILEPRELAQKTQDDSDCSQFVLKAIIQVEQLFQQEIQGLFSSCGDLDTYDVNSVERQWLQIMMDLLHFLMQLTDRDALILLGTAIAMSWNLTLSENCIKNTCMDLIRLLSKEKSTFTFKDIDLDLNVDNLENTDTSNHILAVIKGLLVCCDPKVQSADDCSVMLQVYPYIMNLCLGPVQHHYLAFQTLSLWYQKLSQLTINNTKALSLCLRSLQEQLQVDGELKFLPDATCEKPLEGNSGSSEHLTLFSLRCPVLHSTLSCVWLNWNSPVSGVTEYVAGIFSALLSLWKKMFNEQRAGQDLPQLLLQQLVYHETQLRTKYRALALLIPYIDGCQLTQENTQIKDELIACMKSNNMAAIATDSYKAFIDQFQSVHGKDCTTLWKQIWMPTLISGLTSQDSLQRSKTCTYWLIPTLKVIPDSHTALLNSLGEHFHLERNIRLKYLYLFGWVNVLRFTRELIYVPFPNELTELLRQALCCSQDDIRGEAFLVLCCTMKKAEPMSELEINLLEGFIPNNLKTNSAPFRQSVVTGLRRVLLRIRYSCLTAVNQKRTDEDFLDRSIHFVEWLYQVVMLSLAPGTTYQCRRTAIDVLTAILETLIYHEEDILKKGRAQEASDVLVQFVNSKNMWNFFSKENFITVLACLEDGAQEIQTLCSNLLEKYFKWPSEIGEIRTDVLPMMHHATALLPSPRAYEAHTGILIMSLVLKKYVLDLGLTFSHQVESELNVSIEASTQIVLLTEPPEGDPSMAFVDMLLTSMKESLDAVMDNLASGFKSHPIHGWTSCITQILKDVFKTWRADFESEAWGPRLQELYILNQSVINLMIDVMTGGKTLENCPSFADMGAALLTLIEGDEDSEEGLMSISPSFQLLLSWCWVNIRESCACLGELSHVVLLHSDKLLLSVDVLYNIGQIFVKVLTTCRHRGAIEGCRDGFLVYSSSLLSSKDPYLNNIPRAILSQILMNLSEDSLSSSVTRRSAGLPIIVQTILHAAHKSKNSDLLVYSVEQLYAIASKPLPLDHSQLQDLSQSHALNILKVIFCDAMLAPLLMPSLSKVTILVIEGFDSPSWAVRNAATQLISTLMSRLLGQKNQLNINTTMAEFRALYPDLLDYLVGKIQTCMTSTKSTSLYIVLTLMSKLGSAHSHQHESDLCKSLQMRISTFISNPVYSLRNLSAKAFVALSPSDKCDEALTRILQRVQTKGSSKNELHGWLLCVENFLLSERLSPDMVLKVVEFLMHNCWLLSYTPCLMITRAAMEVVRLCLHHARLSLGQASKLWSMINSLSTALDRPVKHLQVDGSQCFGSCLQTLMAIYSQSPQTNEAFGSQLVDLLSRSMSSPLDDVRCAALDSLEECVVSGFFVPGAHIQKELLAQVSRETVALHVVKAVDIILKLKLDDQTHQGLSGINILPIALLKSNWSHSKLVTDALFSLEGLMFGLAEDVYLHDSSRELCHWSRQLVHFSQPSLNETLRLMAAQALCGAGKNVIEFISRDTSSQDVSQVVTSIIKASVLLLEDTDTEVRETVSRFLCQIENKSSLHYTLCYSILARLIVKLSWSDALLSELIDMLYTPNILKDSVKSALSSRSPQQLFKRELSSAFSEPHMLQLWASNTLQMITERENLAGLINGRLSEALNELKLETSEFTKIAEFDRIFNVNCNAKVMSALFGIFLLSQLYDSLVKCFPSMKLDDGDSLCEHVMWLRQNASLHPFLQKSSQDLKLLMPITSTE